MSPRISRKLSSTALRRGGDRSGGGPEAGKDLGFVAAKFLIEAIKR